MNKIEKIICEELENPPLVLIDMDVQNNKLTIRVIDGPVVLVDTASMGYGYESVAHQLRLDLEIARRYLAQNAKLNAAKAQIKLLETAGYTKRAVEAARKTLVDSETEPRYNGA